MLCVLLVSPKCLGGKCLGGKFLHRVNASALTSTWMVRYAISSTKGLTLVSEFLRDHTAKSAVIFCNSHHQSQHVRDHLERKLNKLQLNVDVLHINGSLHKMDKFWQIRLFCDEGHIVLSMLAALDLLLAF